jgi:hypothetical protein
MDTSLLDEIMKLLIKRETSLADALDALTAVMLNALIAQYGNREGFFRFSEQVHRFPESTERDRAVGLIPKEHPRILTGTVPPRMGEDRVERVGSLAMEIVEVMNRLRPKSLGEGFNALTNTMLTAIEATCGRERADEFDLFVGAFSKEVISGGRVQ